MQVIRHAPEGSVDSTEYTVIVKEILKRLYCESDSNTRFRSARALWTRSDRKQEKREEAARVRGKGRGRL